MLRETVYGAMLSFARLISALRKIVTSGCINWGGALSVSNGNMQSLSPCLKLHHHATAAARQAQRACRQTHQRGTRQYIISRSTTNGNGTVSSNGTGTDSSAAANPYNWSFDNSKPAKPDPKVQELPVASIRRPLGRTRSNGEGHEPWMKSHGLLHCVVET